MRSLSMPALRAYSRTTWQTAFYVKLSPQAFPFLLTLRNSLSGQLGTRESVIEKCFNHILDRLVLV